MTSYAINARLDIVVPDVYVGTEEHYVRPTVAYVFDPYTQVILAYTVIWDSQRQAAAFNAISRAHWALRPSRKKNRASNTSSVYLATITTDMGNDLTLSKAMDLGVQIKRRIQQYGGVTERITNYLNKSFIKAPSHRQYFYNSDVLTVSPSKFAKSLNKIVKSYNSNGLNSDDVAPLFHWESEYHAPLPRGFRSRGSRSKPGE